MTGELVLVTGGSGFVGSHCLVALLREGYRPRTTVRSLARADEVRAMVERGGADPAGIEFVVAKAHLPLRKAAELFGHIHEDSWRYRQLADAVAAFQNHSDTSHESSLLSGGAST